MGTVSLTRLAVKTHRRLPACWWVWLLSVGFNTRRLSSCDIPEVPFFFRIQRTSKIEQNGVAAEKL
jgi:hypothetical protein